MVIMNNNDAAATTEEHWREFQYHHEKSATLPHTVDSKPFVAFATVRRH
jgi:hypothetical protein